MYNHSFNPLEFLGYLSSFRQWATGSGFVALLDSPWIIFYIGIAFLLHPLLGVSSVLSVLILLYLIYKSQKVSRRMSKLQLSSERATNNFIYTKLRNSELLSALGMMDKIEGRWRKERESLQADGFHATKSEHAINSISRQSKIFINSLSIGIGALLVLEGEISIGAMIAASMIMSRCTSPLDNLITGWKQTDAAKYAYFNIVELLSKHARAINTVALIRTKERQNFSLSIRNIFVEKSERYVINDMSFEAQSGDCLLIRGPIGSGKTTLGRVIMGVESVSKGGIFIKSDDSPWIELKDSSLTKGYCPQDINFYDVSVAENISSLKTPESEHVIKSTRSLGIHDFILSLPKGYDSKLGSGGEKLSGGQYQLLSIARAIYKNPRLVFLDEPNSNLDDQSTARLIETVIQLKAHGSLIFIVSHSDAFDSISDKIITMKELL